MATRAAVEHLICQAKRVKGTILLSALVVALILTAPSVLWMRGWFDGESQLVEDVLAVAERRIANGDIRGARRILTAYESVAPGRVALALGETYDPNMLAAWGTRGVPADPDKARLLYGKARDLGVPGAKRRLDNLNLPELPAPKGVASGPRITIARAIKVLRPAIQAGFRIEVAPRQALPGSAFVRIRGLHRSVSLTEGHSIGPGAWAVPMFGLATLEVIAPEGVSGRAEVRVSLVAVDGAVLAEATTNLEVVDPPAEHKSVVVAPGPPPTREPLPSAPPPSAEQKARAERLLAQGRRLWEDGNVAGARNSFERAFQEGLVAAAIDMAKTYDRAELALIEVMGLRPEPDAAIEWYHRALRYGVLEAREPLARLCRRIDPGGAREACRAS